MRKALFILLLITLAMGVFGCEGIRFAASEPQKKIAFQSHVTARDIEAKGTDAHSPAAAQQVQATQAALSYIGLPANPVITDYDTTIAQARADAVRRPDANDVFATVEGGLSLAESLAALFGVGGLTLGSSSLVKWIGLLRTKAKGMEEIVGGNEDFVNWLKKYGGPNEIETFKSFQRLAQTGKTPELVASTRIQEKNKRFVIASLPNITEPPPEMPSVQPPAANS